MFWNSISPKLDIMGMILPIPRKSIWPISWYYRYLKLYIFFRYLGFDNADTSKFDISKFDSTDISKFDVSKFQYYRYLKINTSKNSISLKISIFYVSKFNILKFDITDISKFPISKFDVFNVSEFARYLEILYLIIQYPRNYVSKFLISDISNFSVSKLFSCVFHHYLLIGNPKPLLLPQKKNKDEKEKRSRYCSIVYTIHITNRTIGISSFWLFYVFKSASYEF